MQGDILDPNFGLSAADEYTLIEQCHIVFHSAATVRFHEPLRYVSINRIQLSLDDEFLLD